MDIKKKKKCLTKLIAKIKEVKACEANLKSKRISDSSISLTIVVDYFLNLNESNIPGFSIYIFKSIHYFQLSHLPKYLSRNIILDLFLPKILDYYRASISIISQGMNLKPDLAMSIPYISFEFLLIINNVGSDKNLAEKKGKKLFQS